MGIISEIELLNQKYKFNNSNGKKLNTLNKNYMFITGNVPILLSAPHAVKQEKNKKEKAEDAYTGGITEYLCKTCGCYGIIRNYNELDDPNTDNIGFGLAYKQRILKAIKENNIKLVLDIHGCNDSHNFDFCIGTNNGKNLSGQDSLVDILNLGLSSIGKVAIDEYFKASLNGNVSKYVSENANIPSIQLEISSKFRKESVYLEQLILSLQIIINNIKKRRLLEIIEKSDIQDNYR